MVGIEKEESEPSESLINNSKALCLSEDMASQDDGMILKDLSRSYRMPPEASEPRTPMDYPPEESIVSYMSEK